MKTYIVNMKGKRSVTRPNMVYAKGFALYVDDLGFLSLDGKTVYIPCGGRKALQALVASGLNTPRLFLHLPITNHHRAGKPAHQRKDVIK